MPPSRKWPLARRIFGIRRWNTLLVAFGFALAGLAWGWVSGGYLVLAAADRQEMLRRLTQLLGGGVVGAAWGASISGIRNGWP
jgi:hypothetical protein